MPMTALVCMSRFDVSGKLTTRYHHLDSDPVSYLQVAPLEYLVSELQTERKEERPRVRSDTLLPVGSEREKIERYDVRRCA